VIANISRRIGCTSARPARAVLKDDPPLPELISLPVAHPAPQRG
jgi:hypothetical protein